MYRLSENGRKLIKHYEGKYNKAYLCPAGIPTIGYGHTKGVVLGQVCTKEEAEEWLQDDYSEAESGVLKAVTTSLLPNQLQALASFVFNLGIGRFKSSTMLMLINRREFADAAKEFDRWVNAGGVKLPGLISRRAEERKLFEGKIE